MRTTKERMKSGEAFVGMKRRGSQLFHSHVSVIWMVQGGREVPSETEHGWMADD